MALLYLYIKPAFEFIHYKNLSLGKIVKISRYFCWAFAAAGCGQFLVPAAAIFGAPPGSLDWSCRWHDMTLFWPSPLSHLTRPLPDSQVPPPMLPQYPMSLMAAIPGLQVTRSTLTLPACHKCHMSRDLVSPRVISSPLQLPCQGWLPAPILPWEWKGPLSDRLCLSPMLQP